MSPMTTDDLIAAIGAEPSPVRPNLMRRALGLGLGAGLALCAGAFALGWGVRPDLGPALAGDVFLMAKTALPVLLALAALPLALARARPGATSRAGRVLWAVPAALAGLALAEAVATPPGRWLAEALGHSVATCVLSIPVLSAPVLLGLLLALRRGAPEHPGLCGAAAGLASAGFGAGIYSLYCTEDSPLFYGVWYVLAIGVVAAAGAALGRRWLRW